MYLTRLELRSLSGVVNDLQNSYYAAWNIALWENGPGFSRFGRWEQFDSDFCHWDYQEIDDPDLVGCTRESDSARRLILEQDDAISKISPSGMHRGIASPGT